MVVTSLWPRILDGADVVASFEQVGGEAVAERMGGDGFCDPGGLRRRAHGLLYGTFVDMIAIEYIVVCAWVFGERTGGEDELPGPFAGGIGVFAGQCIREGCAAVAAGQVTIVLGFHGDEVGIELGDAAGRKHRDAIFVALAGATTISLR